MPGMYVHSFYVNEEQRNTPLILLFFIGCLEQIKREAGAKNGRMRENGGLIGHW
jgi:hypothetical protein